MSPFQTFDACDVRVKRENVVTVKQENVVKIKQEIDDNDEYSWGLQQSFGNFKSEAVKMEDVKSEFKPSSTIFVSVIENAVQASGSSSDVKLEDGINMNGEGASDAVQQTKPKLENKIGMLITLLRVVGCLPLGHEISDPRFILTMVTVVM